MNIAIDKFQTIESQHVMAVISVTEAIHLGQFDLLSDVVVSSNNVSISSKKLCEKLKDIFYEANELRIWSLGIFRDESQLWIFDYLKSPAFSTYYPKLKQKEVHCPVSYWHIDGENNANERPMNIIPEKVREIKEFKG